MNKRGKGNVYQNIVLTVIGLVAIGAVSWLVYDGTTEQASLPEGQTQVGAVAEATKEGKIVSFELSVKDNADNPQRYAGTGYVWDVDNPDDLISGGSYTLSATGSTTVSPVVIGQTVEAVAFDATHLGIPERKDIDTEGEQIILRTKNVSGTATNFYLDFFESNSVETTPSLTIPSSSGASKIFDKMEFHGNVSDLGFNLKGMCFGSNATSNSEIDRIEVPGLTSMNVPYYYRNTHFQCYEWNTAQYDDTFDYNFVVIPGPIKVVTTNSFATDELINVTLIDEHQYESVSGAVKTGVQNDNPSPADVGTGNLGYTFTALAG